MADGKGFANVGTCGAFAVGHPATFDQAGFAALTWVPWEEMTDVSGGGQVRTVSSYKPSCSGNEYKVNGGRTRNDLSVKGADVSADPAQVLLRGVDAGNEGKISFREEVPNGDYIYHFGILSGIESDARSAEGVRMLSVTVACSGTPVEVTA